MGKRNNGEGTEIKELVKNGQKYYTWQIMLDGKRKTVTRKVKYEVIAEKRRILKEIAKNENLVLKKEKIKFVDFINYYIENYKSYPNYVKRSTYNNYTYRAEKFIIPTLGDYFLQDIDTEILQDFVTILLKTMKSSSMEVIFVLVKSILKKAVQLGYITKNPADGVELPKIKNQEMQILTPAHIQALLESKLRYKVAFLLILETGIRLAECLGLRWQDVDLKNKHIKIEKNLCVDFQKNEFYLDTPKTETSLRTIPITDKLVELLQTHKGKQELEGEGKGKNWNINNLVFCTTKGGFIYPHSFRTSWSNFLEKNNLQHVRIHDMRHTFCSTAIENGADIATTMRLSGHSNIRTLQRYLHPSEKAKEEAIATITKNLMDNNNNK